MATKKYISLNNLISFLNNLKNIFATKTEVNAKSDKIHTHSISDISNLQSALDSKALTNHGTHVTYSAATPMMDGTASVGSATTVARSDHKHPTDTSRAAQTSLDSHTSNTTSHITSTERTNWGAAYTHSQSTHAPSNAEKNQNAFSYVKVGDTSVAADSVTDTLTLVAGTNVTIMSDANGDSITISSKDTNTTYSAGTGISLSGTTFSNSGVRSVATGSTNGTISVNTNGIATDVSVKGLGSAAYTASSAYDAVGTAQNKADAALASAKAYTDSVKNDLLNGAGTAYDTLKELGDLIDENTDAIDALETVASGKADKSHTHDDRYYTETEINSKVSTLNSAIAGKANSSHTHNISDVTNLQGTLDGKAASSHNHSASNITSGTLSSDRLPTIPISKGGTGATTAAGVLTNLGITSTVSELNYVDGVTSNIQTQLNNKAASSHAHSYLPLSGGNLTGTLGVGNKYELSPAYNYTNGCLINICSAKSSTMVAIHITGNSYNGSTSPIDSLYQFYDYGDGTIMNYSGINLGLSLGVMTVYRYNNRLYAYIKQTASYQTLSFTLLTNKSGLTPIVENAAAHTSGFTDLITITPVNVALSGHTHNYAGSSSAGGAATSAIKATQDASGNVITSTYATKTELDTAKSTLQTSINSKANSSHTHTIANVTNLQTSLDGKANSSHTHSYAGSSSVGGSATSAVKLDTSTAGDANTPVYFTGGKPVACTSLDLNTSGSSASCTGNSATATKLQTARTIALGTGAAGTATSFNGTANITIPVTDVKESYLSWGGRNLSGSVSPIDTACSNIHSANRFAFAKAAGITIEYSTNGSTYSAYSTTDSAKVNLVSGIGSGYYIGARSTSTTVNDKLRITLNATNMGLYTRLQKLLINISTNYATGSNVIIEKSMKGSESTYTTVGTYAISGWSGWNSIPISAAFGGGDTQTYNIANIRLTFGITGVNSSQTANALTITDIIGIGDTYWSYPSTMAKTGHIYTYDSSQNTTFPASVNAPTYSGSGVATVAEVKTYLGI